MKEYVIELFVKNDKKSYLYRAVNAYEVGTELKVLDNNCQISYAIIVKNDMRVSDVGLPYIEEIIIKDESFVLWRVDIELINYEDTFTFKSLNEALKFIEYLRNKYTVRSVGLYEEIL